jgi:DNA-directed RNA polymerase subunit RPC12/RpoP/uncharacterized C2H2 Zn-finger protein
MDDGSGAVTNTEEKNVVRHDREFVEALRAASMKEAFEKSREWSETHTREQLREKLDKKIDALDDPDSAVPEFVCSDCGKVFDTSYALAGHRQKHKAEQQEPVECEICSKEFDNKWGLVGHQQKHVSGSDIVSCGICGEEFRDPVAFNHHKQEHVQERSDSKEDAEQDVKQEILHKLRMKSYRPIARIAERYDVPPKYVAELNREEVDDYGYRCLKCDDIFGSKNGVGTHLAHTHGLTGSGLAEIFAVKVHKTLSDEKEESES